jgi:hypothetical protein
MKKILILMLIVLSLSLVGCLDYKSYEPPADTVEEDTSLLDEIAQIEEELDIIEEDSSEETAEETSEEIVLPELAEEPVASGEIGYVVTVNEAELVSLAVTVTDPDEDNVSYTFTPPLNSAGKWETTYGDAGEYLVTITATDGQLSTEETVKIVVNRVNVAPSLSGVNDLTVKEGETVTFDPEITDLNSDAVSLDISPPLAGGVWATDHTSAGEYQITVTASDGEMETVETFLLVVEDVNELPQISNLQDITVQEGETVLIEPQVSDLDGDDVVITISSPVGDDGVWETTYTDHGTYTVTLTFDDGKDIVNENVRVIVEDVNKPPQIVDVTADVN